MSVENIARAVSLLRAGDIAAPVDGPDDHFMELVRVLADPSDPVVSLESVWRWRTIDRGNEPVDLYGEHTCIAPPFVNAIWAMTINDGTTAVLYSFVIEHGTENYREDYDRWDTTHYDDPDERNEVDWDRVRWTMYVFAFAYGRDGRNSSNRILAGPYIWWRIAIYDDGEPADINFKVSAPISIVGPLEPFDMWTHVLIVLLDGLTFLNCSNVELLEPQRSRGERRRLQRIAPDVRVSEINVFPAGRRTRKADGTVDPTHATPLRVVRGHFASYGEQFGRGKLFGKYEGRFWIPQHARGTGDLIEQRYNIRPQDSAAGGR